MANTVLVADAIAFFVARQSKYTEQAAAARQKWEAARIEYEKGLWFRIFGTRFEDSSKGSIYTGMGFTEQWSFAREECWAEEAGRILNEIAYHNKLRDKRMEWCEQWEKNGWRISAFYAWCQQQGLPS